MAGITPSSTGLRWGPVQLHNVRRTVATEEGIRLGRLPEAALAGLEERTRGREGRATGCELRFRIRSGEAVVRLRTLPMADRPENGLVEIWYGSFPAATAISPVVVGSTGWTEIRIPAPVSDRLVELSAGTRWSAELVRVRLQYDRMFELAPVDGDLVPPGLRDEPARRLCAYGSSITHGSSALLPSATGMWQAADLLGMDLYNLGFPGSAYLEPVIAEAIVADPSWHVATAELGINVVNRWPSAEFAAKVEAFLGILATAGRPVLATGIYRAAPDLEQPEKAEDFRRIVAAACARHGIVHVDSRTFITDWRQLTADLVHPNPGGMAAIGQRWAEAIRPAI